MITMSTWLCALFYVSGALLQRLGFVTVACRRSIHLFETACLVASSALCFSAWVASPFGSSLIIGDVNIENRPRQPHASKNSAIIPPKIVPRSIPLGTEFPFTFSCDAITFLEIYWLVIFVAHALCVNLFTYRNSHDAVFFSIFSTE